MAFILIHEMGHILPALYYKWDIEKVILLPFGGITIFHEKINRPMKEEAIIAIGGVLFQTIFYFILRYFIQDPILVSLHYGLLLFNLLPIFPLDGSKICSLVLNLLFSFKRSHIFMIIISIMGVTIGIFFTYQNLILLLSFFFLSIKIMKEFCFHPYLFQKFLLERYLYTFSFPKIKKIKKIEQMKRDTYHFMIEGKNEKKVIEEKVFLRNLFDKKK